MLTSKDPFEGKSKTIELDGVSVLLDIEEEKEKESKWGFIDDDEDEEQE